MRANVLIPLGNGFEEIEAISVTDVLRRVDCKVVLAKVGEPLNLVVESQGGVKVVADSYLEDVDCMQLDGIVIPGGWEGTQNLIASKTLGEILQTLNAKDKIIAAICAAPLVLFKHGILKNQNFTCYPSIEKMIENPNYQNALNVVRDGNIITSRGPATALEFAFFLAGIFADVSVAKKLQEEMLSFENA